MTDADFLKLTRWLSPAYPLGSFAYSYGLESLTSSGKIAGSEDLEAILLHLVKHGGAQVDAALLHLTLDGADTRSEALARAAGAEREAEMLALGRAFVATLRTSEGIELREGPFVSVFGEAARTLNVPHRLIVAQYLQAFTANLVSVAQRLLPIGQAAGQGILHRLSPVMDQVAAETASLSRDDLGSSGFALDLASMAHETLEARLFRS